MNAERNRFLGFLAATAALALLVGVLGDRVFGSVAGVEGALIVRLKRLEQEGVQIFVVGSELRSSALQFQRIAVLVDGDGRGATVTSTLDFRGELQRQSGTRTEVSSLGVERARYTLQDGEWRPQDSDCPRLINIVAELEQRRRTEQEDAGYHSFQSTRWLIRSDRDEVLVGEDYRFQGTTTDRPLDEKGFRRLTLAESEDGSFRFLE